MTATYLIGTDEAGYGPNLGPLVVSITVWNVSDSTDGEDLYERLAGVIVRTPQQAARDPLRCTAIADSKKLYVSGKGLRHLERGLWAALGTLGQRPETWAQLWAALAPTSTDAMQAIPWYAGYDTPLPRATPAEQLEPLADAIRRGFDAAGVQLLSLQSRAVFPREFNELVDRHDSKGAALSHLTLRLIADAVESVAEGPVSILCDKHGGRNRYAPLLSEHFPDRLIEIHGESRQQSIYRFGPPKRRVEIRFQAKADGHLPAALASMASKYLRELAMGAFNVFWRQHIPNLRPTAGYPEDAKRFRTEVEPRFAELGIDERAFWRIR